MKPARLRPVVLVFPIAALAALAAIGMSACQADPQSPSPSVSGESHFLSPCAASAECAAGLECLCGLCTVACDEDEACAAESSGTRCVDPATCEGGARICAQGCETDADCGDGSETGGLSCLEGACVAASGVGENCAGGECPVQALADNPWCGADCPALADLSRGCIGSHTEQDCTFCGETYVRIGRNDGATLYYRPTGEVAAVAERGLDAACDETWSGLDLSTCVDQGEPREVLCEGQGEPPTGPALVSLALTWGAWECTPGPAMPIIPTLLGACTYTVGVRAPHTLVLTDALGTLEFDLTAEEFATVEIPTWGPGFQAILDRSEPCPGGTDGGQTLTVQRDGEDPIDIRNFTNCQPEAAVSAIIDALRALLAAHLLCPADGPPGLVPLPARALCFACDDCARTDCQGVIVQRGAASYCVGPDSPRFTCPASRPVRARLNGTAVCAAEPGVPNDWTLRQVAREALQTALIQSQASIVRLEMPAEATHFPGLPGGSRVEGTAVIADPGTPWFGGDVGPISCGESFSHLEIEPASEGIGFFVTAWNNVVECGQPQGAISWEFPEPAPFTLPDRPGLYPVVLGQPGDSTAGPILLVEQGDACPAEPPPLDTCATGFLFAECGGALPPAIFCTAQDAPCLWFSGGCPAAGYTQPVECDPTDRTCPAYGTGWGPEPWDRARDMVLPLTVDPAFQAPAEPSVVCTCDTPPCLGAGNGLCNDALTERYLYSTPEVTDPGAPRNGLVVAWLIPDGPELGLTGGRLWVLEADPDLAHARVCLFQTSDAENGGPPSCALSGEVTFDREVRTRGDAGDLHGRALATFEHVPGNPGEIIVIDARF
jgi:hypothetical protein